MQTEHFHCQKNLNLNFFLEGGRDKHGTGNQQLSVDQVKWLEWNLNAVDEFVAIFSPVDAGKPVSLAALDRAYAAYMDSGVTDMNQINNTINVIGITFGSFFIKHGAFEWAIVKDDYGSELAVVSDPEGAKIIVFPNNFIAKRWTKGEKYFIESGFKAVISQVKKIETQAVADADMDKDSKKPWWKSLFG